MCPTAVHRLLRMTRGRTRTHCWLKTLHTPLNCLQTHKQIYNVISLNGHWIIYILNIHYDRSIPTNNILETSNIISKKGALTIRDYKACGPSFDSRSQQMFLCSIITQYNNTEYRLMYVYVCMCVCLSVTTHTYTTSSAYFEAGSIDVSCLIIFY